MGWEPIAAVLVAGLAVLIITVNELIDHGHLGETFRERRPARY